MIYLQNKLINEILIVTMMIQTSFPELYKLLSETPLFMSHIKKDIGVTDFEQYLESLKMQLSTFSEASHKAENV